jgi:hypothetical protein
MSFLNAPNAFATCTTLGLSMQSLNKDIPSFVKRSHSVLMSTIQIALGSLNEMHPDLSFQSHIPCFCRCTGSSGLPAMSSIPPNQAYAVLCDATNESSVSDMLCRDNKEFCNYCK